MKVVYAHERKFGNLREFEWGVVKTELAHPNITIVNIYIPKYFDFLLPEIFMPSILVCRSLIKRHVFT